MFLRDDWFKDDAAAVADTGLVDALMSSVREMSARDEVAAYAAFVEEELERALTWGPFTSWGEPVEDTVQNFVFYLTGHDLGGEVLKELADAGVDMGFVKRYESVFVEENSNVDPEYWGDEEMEAKLLVEAMLKVRAVVDEFGDEYAFALLGGA